MIAFCFFFTKALGLVVKIKDTEALKNELKNDYVITKELSNISGNISLRFGRWLAVADAALITAKHAEFKPLETHSDAGIDEVPNAKQSSVNSE